MTTLPIILSFRRGVSGQIAQQGFLASVPRQSSVDDLIYILLHTHTFAFSSAFRSQVELLHTHRPGQSPLCIFLTLPDFLNGHGGFPLDPCESFPHLLLNMGSDTELSLPPYHQ